MNMLHWLCGSCRAEYRDRILRFDVDKKDLRRTLRGLRSYSRLPLWKRLYLAPLYAASNLAAGGLLGKSIRMYEKWAYVDVSESSDDFPYYVPFPETLSPRHRKIWAYAYVNGLLRFS